MSDDPNLRSQLERIASAVGDPPEHGLERVAARRHRRLRRRRGAVATAAVLAVLATGTALISRAGDGPEAVTASESATPAGAPAELPDRVEVRCEPTGIVIPVASVRPQRDGLHLRVINAFPETTTVYVDGPDGWSSGEIRVLPGVTDKVQPVPPGQVSVGCEIGGRPERLQVNLVDPAGIYTEPELECEQEPEVLRDLAVHPVTTNLARAARRALNDYIVGGTGNDPIGAVRGYPAQRTDVTTEDPVVQVSRNGKVAAFVHVRGADGGPHAPWTTVVRAKVCPEVLVEGATTTTQPSGTTTTAAG